MYYRMLVKVRSVTHVRLCPWAKNTSWIITTLTVVLNLPPSIILESMMLLLKKDPLSSTSTRVSGSGLRVLTNKVRDSEGFLTRSHFLEDSIKQRLSFRPCSNVLGLCFRYSGAQLQHGF